jgi:hypothetical protein
LWKESKHTSQGLLDRRISKAVEKGIMINISQNTDSILMNPHAELKINPINEIFLLIL